QESIVRELCENVCGTIHRAPLLAARTAAPTFASGRHSIPCASEMTLATAACPRRVLCSTSAAATALTSRHRTVSWSAVEGRRYRNKACVTAGAYPQGRRFAGPIGIPTFEDEILSGRSPWCWR